MPKVSLEPRQTDAVEKPAYDALVTWLISSALSRKAPEEANEDEAVPYYAVSVDQPLRVGETTIHFCKLVAGNKLRDLPVEMLEATYVFAFHSSEDLSTHPLFRNLLTDVVKRTVWPRFRDLFALIVSQANLDFPPLPLSLDKVEFEEKSDRGAST
jgi:hypothetical protein